MCAEIEARSPKGRIVKRKDLGREEDLPTHPARIRVDGGLTKNLGDYESARLSVSVEIPCGISDDEIVEAYRRISSLVEKLLEEEYQQVIGEYDNQ